MKLIATGPIQHGTKDEVQSLDDGDSFDVPSAKQAEALITSGAALKPADYKKAAKDAEAAGDAVSDDGIVVGGPPVAGETPIPTT